ncbi:MAG: hypothetical protein M1819_004826 [Sarea resinae]|nr:MAG: hypothetical protein M1819_004826 [Sarea resinae]
MTAAIAQVPNPGDRPDVTRPVMAEEPWRENLNMQMICRDCKEFPPNLVEEFSSGDMVCGSCGLVLGDRIVDTRSEWRTFSNDDQGNDDPSRVGDAANPLLNGSQLETTISFGDGGSRSRELHRAQNKSTHDKDTKNLLAAYKEIGAYSDKLAIPKTASDAAKQLFKKVDDAKAFKGKSTDAVIAGCLFIGCRQTNANRTFQDIFRVTNVSKKEIGRIFKHLEKFFTIENKKQQDLLVQGGGVVNPNDSYTTTTSTNAKDLCSRYCSQLGLPSVCMMVAEGLAEKMSLIGALAGRSPISAAAACIYMASYLMKHGKTPKEISAVAGVSDGTIRTAYKNLYAEKERLIDPKWIQDGKGDMKNLPAT